MILLILTIAAVTSTILILVLFYIFIENLTLKYINRFISPIISRYVYKIYVIVGILGLICTLVIIIFLTRVGGPGWEEWNLAEYRHTLWQQISAWVLVFSPSFPGLAFLARRITGKEVLEQRNLIKEAGIAAGIVLAVLSLAAPLFV